jgi:glycosyltransferase involved in cell wall biosynthesis
MSNRPSLLFVSPTLPALGGNGLAMRMGVFLEAYARNFEVTLVIVPLSGQAAGDAPSSFIQRHAARTIVLPMDRLLHPLFQLIARHRDPAARRAAMRAYPRPHLFFYDPIVARELLARHLGSQHFALVHAGRSYTAPLVEAYLGRSRCVLDLDEDDGHTLRSIAALLAANGDQAGADDEIADAAKYETLIGEYLPRFDLSLVASEKEAAALSRRYPAAALGVIPNAIRHPAPRGESPIPADLVAPIDFLMVGSLGYYPNADAAQFFCRDILPRIGQGRVTILGSRPPASILALGKRPGISVLADVALPSPYYAAARIAVVPIRAGGGSRIKILEAFAHGRPVVATRLGAEGLGVVDGQHLLIADTADDFAACARRLAADPDLAARLVSQAHRLVEQRYALGRVASMIEKAIEPLADPPDGVIECAHPRD